MLNSCTGYKYGTRLYAWWEWFWHNKCTVHPGMIYVSVTARIFWSLYFYIYSQCSHFFMQQKMQMPTTSSLSVEQVASFQPNHLPFLSTQYLIILGLLFYQARHTMIELKRILLAIIFILSIFTHKLIITLSCLFS